MRTVYRNRMVGVDDSTDDVRYWLRQDELDELESFDRTKDSYDSFLGSIPSDV